MRRVRYDVSDIMVAGQMYREHCVPRDTRFGCDNIGKSFNANSSWPKFGDRRGVTILQAHVDNGKAKLTLDSSVPIDNMS